MFCGVRPGSSLFVLLKYLGVNMGTDRDCNWISFKPVCSSASKRSTNNQYVCKYIGRITDQSKWSGPFSLVVMMLDYRSRGTWFDPRSGHSTGIFSLQVYFSSYYMWCLVPGWLLSEPKGDAMATESQKSLGIVENIWYKCFIVGWRSVVARQSKVQIINMYVKIWGA